ncbi:MAG TPA: histidine kinase dimerization/phospho-acceptor domain-containing protein [Gemmataceae bacterium]|nr:histidine kinase dimerization/phospho-acceptor domain-containing protein [Gemmataceae bacterium]
MEAVGVLAGGVAHDFNNLLMVINGYSEAALGQSGRKAPVEEALQGIRNAGLRAAALTRQLLAFSRKQLLAPTVLNLNSLVTEAQKMLGRLIGETCVLAPPAGELSMVRGRAPQKNDDARARSPDGWM